ncbi:MAG: methyl-accepting chemotaxis protein, partial [Desulfobacteraceae bacterium]|nr:methyl-accepting chemotaxis protein [Desulfobacteraceae bacterium]
MKNLNLKMKMLLYIGMVAFLSFAVTIGVVAVMAGNMARENAIEETTEIAHRYSGVVKADIEVAMDTARTLAQSFEGMKESTVLPDRQMINAMLKQIMVSNPHFFGTWTIWDPNALDGRDREFANTPGHDASGRFVPVWERYSGELIFRACGSYEQEGVGDYYLVPRRTGGEGISDPYQWTHNGKTVLLTTLTVPIKHRGMLVGVVGIDISLEAFQEHFSEVKVYETGYLSIVSNKGLYVSHPKPERIGESLLKTDPWAEPFMNDIKSGNDFITSNHSASLGEAVSRVCEPIWIGKSKTPWAVMVNIPMSKVLAKAQAIRNISMGIGTVAMALLMTTIFFIVSGITGPIRKGVAFAESMATGDFSHSLEINQNDEVGKFVDSLNHMTSSIGGMIKEISTGVETLSSSSTDLAAISEQMSQGANETSEKSGTVAAAAEEMSAGMTSIAAAMEQATTNVTMVATASEEMTSTINEVAKNTESARTIADSAVSQAKTASDKIAELGA